VTSVDEAEKEGSPAAGTAAPESNAQSRACAREDTPAPASVALQAVTDSAQAVRRTFAQGVKSLDRPGTLADAQPPTFRQARDYHHRCAGHFNALLFSVPRIVWGYLHMAVVKPVLNLAEWVTESPLRCAVALAVYYAVRHWG
jgi:hypothetical protein